MLHKFERASKLKHPQTEQKRATQRGVSHKYCSKEQQSTIKQNIQQEICNLKISSKIAGNIVLLCDHLWSSFEENKLYEFDLNFLDNWLSKKVEGRSFHDGEQAQSLAILQIRRKNV